ncbi:hypothetical protein HZS_158 [Henneguya salminicola]|nr:hypothetical protein HZS_158 [Henneguya salminicola]
MMRYNTHTYIDATFRSSPSPYTQYLIIMLYDLFNMNSFFMDFYWMPKYITMDFELGMIRAITPEFQESRFVGCYFHFKQAINKKLPKLKISNQDLKIILEKIELLTLVSINEMDIAINITKSLNSNDLNLEKFGKYFQLN